MREVEADQLRKLNTLLDVIRRDNPFYAARLRAMDSGLTSLEELAQKIPFTRKQELIADQLEYPPYGSNLTYPLPRYTRFSQTSATTGSPMHWLDTPESWNWMPFERFAPAPTASSIIGPTFDRSRTVTSIWFCAEYDTMALPPLS